MVKEYEEGEEGEFEEDVYTEEGQEELVENDEITDIEEGIMEGYEEGEHEAKCAQCKKILIDEDFIEEEIDGKHLRFCSEECATKFEKSKHAE